MSDENVKQKPQVDVIALPPLKMTLVHAKEERINRTMLAAAIESAILEEEVKSKTLMKIIEHLEKKP